MAESRTGVQEPLLIEQVARLYRFDRLATKLPGSDIYPPYLMLAVAFVIDFGVVNTYKMMTGYQHIVIANPPVIAGWTGIWLAAIGIRYMTANYSDAVEYIGKHNSESDTEIAGLQRLVSSRTKWAVLGVAAVSEYVFILFISGLDTVLAFEGPAGLVNVLFVHEFLLLPFVAEFAVVYFSVHFLVPKQIHKADINLFHYDPRNMGGFAAIGQLLKRSYYLYTAGLLLYFTLVYGPFILPFGNDPAKPGLTAALFFSAAWLVGLASIAYSMLRMHQIMASQKEQRIQELEDDLQTVIEKSHDITSATITDRTEYDDIQQRLNQVRSTRVYPATFTMWSQIAISVLLPQALQIAVQATP